MAHGASHMAEKKNKTLMRNLGEFVGHIFKAVKTEPRSQTVVKKTVEEEDRGDVVLRRTTIDEVEIKGEQPPPGPPTPDP